MELTYSIFDFHIRIVIFPNQRFPFVVPSSFGSINLRGLHACYIQHIVYYWNHQEVKRSDEKWHMVNPFCVPLDVGLLEGERCCRPSWPNVRSNKHSKSCEISLTSMSHHYIYERLCIMLPWFFLIFSEKPKYLWLATLLKPVCGIYWFSLPSLVITGAIKYKMYTYLFKQTKFINLLILKQTHTWPQSSIK